MKVGGRRRDAPLSPTLSPRSAGGEGEKRSKEQPPRPRASGGEGQGEGRATVPGRHELVWLRPSWHSALCAPLEPAALDAVARWIAAGRPLVAARRSPTAPDAVALGLALPDRDRRRVSLLVAPAAVARIAPPLPLAAALGSAPPSWHAPLAALDLEAREADLVLRVYGSLAWQHLSGEAYVTDRSDVDLLVSPRDAAALRAALRLLAAHAADRAPPLDGEVVLPGGGGVAWRELLGAHRRVLVKAASSVWLEAAEAVLGAAREDGR